MSKPIIDGIHHYCDRWCERCNFVDRCEVGLQEQQDWENGDETKSHDALWLDIHQHFQQIFHNIDQLLKDAGLNTAALEVEPFYPAHPELDVLLEAMHQRTLQYLRDAGAFMKKMEKTLADSEQDLENQLLMGINVDLDHWGQLLDALDVIRWYSTLIGAKASRAIMGLEDKAPDGSPFQTDANGSAKVAMIGIDRSLGAWEIVREHFPEKTDELLDLFIKLRSIRQEMERLFPQWSHFQRPGFDQPF